MIFLVIWLALPFNGTGTMTYEYSDMHDCEYYAPSVLEQVKEMKGYRITGWRCLSSE